MDERTDQFIASFQAFLDEVLYASRRADGDEPTLIEVLTEHLGADPRRLPAVLQRGPEPRFGQLEARMEILTTADGLAGRLIATARELMLERSVLRGQALSLGGSDYQPGIGDIVFHRRPVIARDEIILPPGVLDPALSRCMPAGCRSGRPRWTGRRPARRASPRRSSRNWYAVRS